MTWLRREDAVHCTPQKGGGVRGIATMITAIALTAAAAAPADATTGVLPTSARDLLLVGDSITAGLHFLELSPQSARECWSGQLCRRLGIPPDSLRLRSPYPLDHLGLAQRGFGIGGFAYPRGALPALLPGGSWFGDADDHIVWAVPGQRTHEVLLQSRRQRNARSAGWTFGRRMLRDASVIEAIERRKVQPRWVVVFIGANDLLASLDIVSGDRAPEPEVFGETYSELVRRLRAIMPADVPARQLCVATLPDVTQLPLLQSAPPQAVDARGRPLEPGSKVAAFVSVYRSRFDHGEYWPPATLAATRQLALEYNAQIRAVAARESCTVIDVAGLLDELHADPDFSALRSSYFSPDLHHPSYRTHAAIANRVLDAITTAAGAAPFPAPAEDGGALPSAADLSPAQQSRADALLFLAMRALQRGAIPPRPTLRFAAQNLAQAGPERAAGWGAGIEVTLESTPTPVRAGWTSRGMLGARALVLSFDDRRAPLHAGAGGTPEREGFTAFRKRGVDFRAGMAFEPVGRWHWTRIAGGIRVGLEGSPGAFARLEWRSVYADASARGLAPDRFELGARWSRPVPHHTRND